MAAARRSVPLQKLLDVLPPDARVAGSIDREIVSLEIDSRSVQRGSLFVALRGLHTDGHAYVEEAVRGGAAAILTEEPCELPTGVTAIVVNDSARALSRLADSFYAHPSKDLHVVGITGTNGKTTTTHMAAAIMNAASIPTASIGTIGASFAGHSWPLENTTPLAPQLHGLLAELRNIGARGVAMEVSSHALALARVADVRFGVAALTNVTRDHLDFHKSFEAYAAAKRSLFDQAAMCVFNGDDTYGARWAHECSSEKPVLVYGTNERSNVRAVAIELQPESSRFTVDGQMMNVRLPGRFNVSNALCAIAIARSLEIPDTISAAGLAEVERVPGRMESLHSDGITVVVVLPFVPVIPTTC
ncbi:MAG: UDP-N-acetylmuramyl-tripeptide synthetase, partial [Candidatus Eremiobacteraeota bacterium]|nr:UDP-N-acetylmuramyl-tripeptide synthetase [Candidatus Eremiobacteraeota bacterium]